MQVNETFIFIYFSMNGQGRHFFLKKPPHVHCNLDVSIIVEVILTSIFYITKFRSGCLVAARANKSPHLDLVFTFETSLSLCCPLFYHRGDEALWFCRGVSVHIPPTTWSCFREGYQGYHSLAPYKPRYLISNAYSDMLKLVLYCDYPKNYGCCYCNAYHYNCNVCIIIMIHTVWLLSQSHLFCILSLNLAYALKILLLLFQNMVESGFSSSFHFAFPNPT